MVVRRGPEGFQKRQRELQKKKKAEEKLARKRERKEAKRNASSPDGEPIPGEPLDSTDEDQIPPSDDQEA